MLAAFAFVTVLLTLFRRTESLAKVTTRVHYHHLGNLQLTFVLFWAYISFGQLLIIYSGDVPRELDWYLRRLGGHWKYVVDALALFHFFVPFLLLLFRGVKRHIAALTILAALLLVMRMVDIYWLVMPALHPLSPMLHWTDLATLAGIGGLWTAVFLSRLRSAPLLPQRDPGMQFAFVYER